MTLNPRIKAILGIMLSFMISFSAIGYATITGTLEIATDITYKTPQILYVKDASVKSGTANITYKYGTNIGNPAGLLDATLDFTSSDTVSIFVTILHNNTTATEGLVYKDTTLINNTESTDNEFASASSSFLSKLSLTDINPETSKDSPLELGEYMTFTITYKYDSALDSDRDKIINISTSFNFVYASQAEAEKATANAVLEAFEEAVNGDDVNINYNALADAMEKEQSKKYGIIDYIGNVVGAGNADTTFVESVFGDTLSSVAFGDEEPTKCTVMVKRLDVDGNGQYDRIVLYITPDTLNGTLTTQQTSSRWGSPGEESTTKNSNGRVTVYAAVFDVDESGKWIQHGDIYKGIAETNTYYQPVHENYTKVNNLDNVTSGYTETSSGNFFSTTTTRVYKCDSVYTDSWLSVSGEYTNNGTTYNIGEGYGINDVIATYDYVTNK